MMNLLKTAEVQTHLVFLNGAARRSAAMADQISLQLMMYGVPFTMASCFVSCGTPLPPGLGSQQTASSGASCALDTCTLKPVLSAEV